MQARYADGAIPLASPVECTLEPDGIVFEHKGERRSWPYAALWRADDGNGQIILRWIEDNGERLSFGQEARAELQRFSPHLFSARVQGVERLSTVAALAASAWTMLIALLVGVPMAAAPLADFAPPAYRARLAQVSWAQVQQMSAVCENEEPAAIAVNTLAQRLAGAGAIAHGGEVRVFLAQAGIPNAFALPDNSIVVTVELIDLLDSPDELAGILAHEVAHIADNHVMRGFIRSVGAGIFFDVVLGGSGAGQAAAIASMNLVGLRYSREDEAQADAHAIELLERANIDPGGLARGFQRLAAYQNKNGIDKIPELLSSHPATAARAEAAAGRARPNSPAALSDDDWETVTLGCYYYQGD